MTENRFLKEEYTARINRVLDYIEENISGDLSLRTLASVAVFLPIIFTESFGP